MSSKINLVIDMNNLPEIKYPMSYGSVPSGFYNRSEIEKLTKGRDCPRCWE